MPKLGSTVLVIRVANENATMVVSPPLKLRRPSRLRFTSGFSTVSSTARKHANSSAAATISVSMNDEVTQYNRCR